MLTSEISVEHKNAKFPFGSSHSVMEATRCETPEEATVIRPCAEFQSLSIYLLWNLMGSSV